MLIKKIILIILNFFLLFLINCGDEDSRPELVDKFKALGVKANPPVITGSESASNLKKVILTIYTLLLKDQTITSVKAFKDEGAQFSIPLDPETGALTILESSADYTDLGPLKLYSIQAEALVPPKIAIPLAQYNGVAKIRYGIQLTDSLGEREDVVGDFLVVAEGDESLSWVENTPSIEFLKPEKDSGFKSGEDLDIQVKVDKPRDETIKVGWFVSSGKVKNFRDNTTKWEEPSSGEQILLATVYAPKSRFFDFIYKKINFDAQ